MACKQILIGAIAAALVSACGGASNKVICNPVPSFASPAVSCVAVAEKKPPPPVARPEPKPEPRPEPEPEPKPEPPRPVVVKKESIELDRTVQFEPDSAKLIADSKDLLDEVARALDAHPEIKLLSIEGHTDSRMSSRHNQKLSVQRANSVRSYLIKKGIAKDRLVTKGFGETQPIADNSTWKGRFDNRRVHLRILKRDEGEEARGASKLDADPADDAETKPAPKHAHNTPRSSGKKKAEAESE